MDRISPLSSLPSSPSPPSSPPSPSSALDGIQTQLPSPSSDPDAAPWRDIPALSDTEFLDLLRRHLWYEGRWPEHFFRDTEAREPGVRFRPMIHNGTENKKNGDAFYYGTQEQYEESSRYLETEWNVRWRAGEFKCVCLRLADLARARFRHVRPSISAASACTSNTLPHQQRQHIEISYLLPNKRRAYLNTEIHTT